MPPLPRAPTTAIRIASSPATCHQGHMGAVWRLSPPRMRRVCGATRSRGGQVRDWSAVCRRQDPGRIKRRRRAVRVASCASRGGSKWHM
jgi:hypothetical protein